MGRRLILKIRPHGNKWRADAGLVLGLRQQRVFDRKKDAEIWLRRQEQIRQDTRAGIRRITAEQERLASMAFGQLAKHGSPDDAILEAVRRFCVVSAPSKAMDLKDAVFAFERDLLFGNRSPVYVDQIVRQLNRFARDLPLILLHELTAEQVRDWLQSNCATAINRSNRRRELRVFFSWATKQGIITENPVDRIPRVSVDRGRPEILTVDQVRSALQNLEGPDRALFAIMVFTGLRPSEAEALHWEDVKLDRGFLEAKRGFREDNRNVRLSENLISWLKIIAVQPPFLCLPGTKTLVARSPLVFPGHTRRWRDRVRRAIAIGSNPIPNWSQDILRHTFGSYHLEAFKDASNTAHEMGHRGNPRMLYAHYRELVTPEAAAEFWKIFPN